MKKKIVLVLLLSFVYIYGYAQKGYKLVEKSSKDKPKWTTSSDPYLFQAIKVATLEDAKNTVKSDLLSQIASSVASTISTNVTIHRNEQISGNTNEYKENVEIVTKTKIAKMPAFQGISLTNASIYWERYIKKKTKETYYDYYMLYPFSTFELQELIDEYNEHEKAVNDRIDAYRDTLDGIDDIDVLLENIAQMERMKQELADETEKCNRLSDVIKQYEQTLKNIYIDVLENSNEYNNGVMVFQLKYDEKIMKTKSLPQLRSASARDFTKKHNGNRIVLTFNTYDCYVQDNNYVEVRFTFGKIKLIKKININL